VFLCSQTPRLLRRLTIVVAIVLFSLLFFGGLFVLKNTLGFSILNAQSLGKHKNSWVKSKYSLGTGEAQFSLGRGE